MFSKGDKVRYLRRSAGHGNPGQEGIVLNITHPSPEYQGKCVMVSTDGANALYVNGIWAYIRDLELVEPRFVPAEDRRDYLEAVANGGEP